jgi:hypothetical protein
MFIPSLTISRIRNSNWLWMGWAYGLFEANVFCFRVEIRYAKPELDGKSTFGKR